MPGAPPPSSETRPRREFVGFPQLAPKVACRAVLTDATGFLAFDFFKGLLADEDGNVTGSKTVLAGLGAGVTESLLAVTPFESIKTQMWVSSGQMPS